LAMSTGHMGQIMAPSWGITKRLVRPSREAMLHAGFENKFELFGGMTVLDGSKKS
jgi:hypothetical protein